MTANITKKNKMHRVDELLEDLDSEIKQFADANKQLTGKLSSILRPSLSGNSGSSGLSKNEASPLAIRLRTLFINIHYLKLDILELINRIDL